MGKTGSVQWTQVKGVKGQIRLVPKAEGEVKKPGPNQRFKAGASLRKMEEASGEGRGGFSRPGGRGGRGGRRSSPGGRSSESGPVANPMVRKAMRRSKASILGSKQKSAR
ncbi:MAG: DUF5350 domain-containing protein [Methanolinea sp.]|nr:DUF5350 domain-containing protein [Methanolinea sp.]